MAFRKIIEDYNRQDRRGEMGVTVYIGIDLDGQHFIVPEDDFDNFQDQHTRAVRAARDSPTYAGDPRRGLAASHDAEYARQRLADSLPRQVYRLLEFRPTDGAAVTEIVTKKTTVQRVMLALAEEGQPREE